MDVRDIIDALEESPFWKTIPASEKIALVLRNASTVDGQSMAELLQYVSTDEQKTKPALKQML
ncbi:MAG TPA: hypothetical protein VK452_04835 [Dissulfurispiraceae bacterium]|nr:hypothetical protein [Dissulfurispiraceae bacterium]